MKKVILSIAAFVVVATTSNTFAQEIYTPGGTIGNIGGTRVGIGTNNPDAKLTVSDPAAGITIKTTALNTFPFVSFFENNAFKASISWNGIADNFGITSPMGDVIINPKNNLGISNNAPSARVDVGMITANTSEAGIRVTAPYSFTSGPGAITAPHLLSVRKSNSGGTGFIDLFMVKTNGNVGIGTSLDNNPNNYKLAVNGTIGAKEIQVENTSTAWPDYVFANDYRLKSLQEVETFIAANSHLPEVPSAAEVNENGIKLGEMDAVLLKKIEELTLYLIEMNKENEALRNRVEVLENK